jgi:putative transposase
MERFFWSLEHEWKKFESFDNIAQARLSVLPVPLTRSTTQKEFNQTFRYRTTYEFEEQYRAKSAV